MPLEIQKHEHPDETIPEEQLKEKTNESSEQTATK